MFDPESNPEREEGDPECHKPTATLAVNQWKPEAF